MLPCILVPGVDSHTEGVDSLTEGVDSHTEGVDSHTEGVDSMRPVGEAVSLNGAEKDCAR